MSAYDVVIVGGGPAASVAAIHCARAGASTCVVPGRQTNDRIEVLTPLAMRTLIDLGLAEERVASIAHRCPGIRSSWNTAAETFNDFIGAPNGPPSSVDRRALDAALLRCAREAGATIADVQHARSWRPAGDGAIDIELDGASLVASHLVLATGAAASRWRGSHPVSVDDQLIALVARDGTRPATLDKRLTIVATSIGWWYAAAGPRDDLGYALLTDRQTIASGGVAATWQAALAEAPRIAGLLAQSAARGRRRAVPVRCGLSPLRPHPRVTRIGDALVSFDPIAGRGLSEAIRTAGEAVEAICAGQSLDPLERRIGSRYRDYLEVRASYYASAWRRFDSAFWQRRIARRSPVIT